MKCISFFENDNTILLFAYSQTENSSSDEPDEEPNMDVLNKLDTILEKDDVLFVISDDKQKKQEDHICPGRLMTKNSYNHLHGQIISSTDMVGDCCGQKSKNNDSYTMVYYSFALVELSLSTIFFSKFNLYLIST